MKKEDKEKGKAKQSSPRLNAWTVVSNSLSIPPAKDMIFGIMEMSLHFPNWADIVFCSDDDRIINDAVHIFF